MSEAKKVEWRQLIEGTEVWAPFGTIGWRQATIIKLGKNRKERTVCSLRFEMGGSGKRYAQDLYWRDPARKGKDKPEKLPASESALETCSAE